MSVEALELVYLNEYNLPTGISVSFCKIMEKTARCKIFPNAPESFAMKAE